MSQQYARSESSSMTKKRGSQEGKDKKPKCDRFYESWDKFTCKPPPPKISVVEALDRDAEDHAAHYQGKNADGSAFSENAAASFEEAAETCRKKVEAIVKECTRLNMKYTDSLFNPWGADAIESLSGPNDGSPVQYNKIGAIKRVPEIFKNPRFIIDGATASDVMQGRAGDCWFLAAISALGCTEEPGQKAKLLTKLCIARDEKVGVYGFIFHRDGEWISEVVDDRLVLYGTEEQLSNRYYELPKRIRDSLMKGSQALYFASCRHSNETWLPLIEKAYAKAHGDYASIEAGWPGEGIEDLTGGVSFVIMSEDVLDKDQLWKELEQVNKDFLFGCATVSWSDREDEEHDVVSNHAYTVMEVRELNNERLLKVRNPWGKYEWKGDWSDGSSRWTSDTLKKINHTFGDDGIFWINFPDFLKYYPQLFRTRLFGPEWTISQQWTSAVVPYNAEYLTTKFALDIPKAGPIVIVLSQPDDRYFRGLEGRYSFDLHFRLYRQGQETYILRSMQSSGHNRNNSRSCIAEFDAEPGKYTVLMKITASRDDNHETREQTIRRCRIWGREKLLSVGRNFDLAHSKGRLREAENTHVEKTKTEDRQLKKDKRVAKLKSEKGYNRRVHIKDKLKKHRIEDETKRKKAAKAEERRAEKLAKAAKESSEAAGNERTSSASSEGSKLSGQPMTESEVDEAAEKVEQLNVSDQKTQDDNKESTSKDEENVTSEETKDQDATAMSGESEEAETVEKPDNSEDAASEVSSVSEVVDDDFDWNSEIDEPVSEPDSEEEEDEDKEDDIFSEDPWNAICVVGLRVYSKEQRTLIEVC